MHTSISYDPFIDSMVITVIENATVATTRLLTPGVTANLGSDRQLISIEILDASHHGSDPNLAKLLRDYLPAE